MGGESEGARVGIGEEGEGRGKERVLGEGGKMLHIIKGSKMFTRQFATCLGQSL